MHNRKIAASILVCAGLIGFAFAVYRMALESEIETLEVNVPLMAITQSGILMLSAILMTSGAYLAGYRKGSRTSSRVTLDFSKKMEA
jgi:hypothetical protein